MTENNSEKVNNWLNTAINGFKTAASNGVSFFKKSWVILTLVTALVGAAGYLIYLNHKQQTTEEELAIQTQKNDELRAETEKVISINQENQKVLEQLKEDRKRTDQLVESFNQQLNLNSKVLSTIGNKVSNLQDGQLAPVLRETVRELQHLRFERQK